MKISPKLNLLKYLLNKLLSIILILGLTSSTFFCSKEKEIESPKVIDGVIDLRKWNFNEDGIVKLDGNWEFYESQLLDNSDFKKLDKPKMTGYIQVPKKWSDTQLNLKNSDGMGYGTYRLRVLIQPKVKISLKYKTIGSSFNLYFNDKNLLHIGKVGETKDKYLPDWIPGVLEIEDIETENDLIIQVSNFSVRGGGIWDSLIIGGTSKIVLRREIALSRDTFFCGSLLMIGLYHIANYYFRRKDKSNILFGIFCLLMSLRSILIEEIIIRKLFPEIPWIVIANLEYFTFFFAVPIFVSYIRSCFPDEFNLKIYKYIILSSSIICFSWIIAPIHIYTILLRPLQIITIFSSFYVFSTALRALKNNRDGAYIFSVVTFISILFVINDVLHNFKIINTGYYSTIAWFFFIFTQAYLLSKRASSAMSRVEDLTENLERQVKSRTRELSLERDNLINANMEIEKLSESRKRLSMIGEMASGIVHDIKNPISTIKTFTDLVKNDDITEIEKKEYLSYIAREIDRLSDLAYDILDFSKGNIQIYPELVNPAELLKEVYQFIKIDFDHSQISINLEILTDTIIYMDKERIRRVIINLANNAREEMNDGLKNYLFIIKLYKTPNYIVFEFIDNGNGLREEVKNKIFEAFYSEGKIKGTGLGLYMCKTIIDAHKGKIEYQTEIGVGTTFYLYLPIIKE